MMYIKGIIDECALRNGLSATFMPKPVHDEPGSGMHFHTDRDRGRHGDSFPAGIPPGDDRQQCRSQTGSSQGFPTVEDSPNVLHTSYIEGSNMKRLLPLLTLLLVLLPACLSPEARLQQGDVYYQRGLYAYALRQYQMARADDPDLPGIDQKIHDTQILVCFAQGDRFVQERRWDAARRSYEDVRRLDPGNTEIDQRIAQMQVTRANHHFARGQQLLGQGNPFDALGEFEQALVYQPGHPRAQRALELARQKKMEQERRSETCYQNGVLALRMKRYEDAVRQFTRALELNPHHPGAGLELRNVEATLVDAWIADGDAEMAARRYGQALDFYRKAYQRSRDVPGLVARIDQAEREQRVGMIIAEGDRCLDNRQWQQAYDKFYEAQRLTAEPEILEQRILRARDGYANEIYGTAHLAEKSGRYEEALAGFASVPEMHPTFRDTAQRHRSLRTSLERAERSYSAGCSAQVACNLVDARDQLQVCVETLPAYRDAAQRLAEVKGSISMAERLYTRGKQAEMQRDFPRARMLYEECLALSHPYRDVGHRLIGMRKLTRPKVRVPQYETALDALSKRDLRRARSLFITIDKTHHGYGDVARRLTEIEAAIAKAQSCYDQAIQAEKRCQLNVASNFYTKALSICTPFGDAKTRLVGVNATLDDIRLAQRYDRARQLTKARKHYQQALGRHAVPLARQRVHAIDQVTTTLARNYGQMVKAQKQGKSRQALGLALGIRKQCTDYKDVETRIPELETEADYADGEALAAQGRDDAALKAFERASKRNPKYKKVQKRMNEIRSRKHHAKPGK